MALTDTEKARKISAGNKLYDYIKTEAKARGLTQLEIEDAIGVKHNKITDLRYGKASKGVVLALCKYFGVEREMFYNDKTWSLLKNTSSKVFVNDPTQEQLVLEEPVDEENNDANTIHNEPTKDVHTIMTACINLSVYLIDMANAIKASNERLVSIIDGMGEELFKAYNEVYGLVDKDYE